jgi:phospholipase C
MTDDAKPGDPKLDPDAAGPSRRDFLRLGGAAATGAVVGGAAGYAAATAAAGGFSGGPTSSDSIGASSTAAPPASLPPRAAGAGFDHLVVVMFENRSFDNLFGYLYAAGQVPAGQQFAGLVEGEYSNPDHDGKQVAAHPFDGSTDEIMSSPRPDPGEDYPHVNTQLFGTVHPAGNAHQPVAKMKKPYNAPSDGATPTMDGFVKDYANNFQTEHGRAPKPDELAAAMGAFAPEMLPVFSALAQGFGVFDHWHCGVPGPTFCNRSFFHASTSHGFVTNHDNGGYKKWHSKKVASPTIFNRLEDAGIPWAVYYDDSQHVSMTGLIHKPVLEQYWKTRFFPMSTFYQACADGTLPAYAFVEPRMVYDHNDMHPPVGTVDQTDVDGAEVTGGAISDVRAGEALLHRVYTAVRDGGSADGSNAINTMLLVTFDEHGGTYDHVAPPSATPPDDSGPGEMDFTFDRLGLRVPVIAISAYVPAGSVINSPAHHGTVISTLAKKYQLKSLTARDADAPTLDDALTATEPRQPSTWPHTLSQYTPRNPESDPVPPGDDDRPLSPPGRGLMGLLGAHAGTSDPLPTTFRQAHDFIEQHGKGLFGPDGG